MVRGCAVVMAGCVAAAVGLSAQATGVPSFSAPDRDYQQSEFGAVVSAPNGNGTAFEGEYRYAVSALDIELRGGFYDPGPCCRTAVLVGAEARDPVIAHSATFPLDGAVIAGLGAEYEPSGTLAYLPVGLSLGRRLPSSRGEVSLEPYVQPTACFVSGGGAGTVLDFTLGVGADLRLNGNFDARFSAGIGDLNGIALGAVWLH